MRKTILWFAILGFLATGGKARADGMVVPETQTTGGSVEVRATQQRAVLWLRAASDPEETPTWEIHIQPVFDRTQGNAAWIVPFPVRPEIHEGSQELLDQLNLLTSPVFIDFCQERSCSCSGYGDAGVGQSLGTTTGGNSGVAVWEQGTVGTLDYAVLSTDSGEDLAVWLADEGYDLPAAAAPLLADYEVEGTFFFVSRLSSTADPALPMTTVRFVLPGLDRGFYPLRLTGLGVGPTDRLGLTLWVIYSQWEEKETGNADRVAWIPDSHTWWRMLQDDPSGPEPMTPQRYNDVLESYAKEDADLVVTFAGTLRDTLMDGQVCTYPYEEWSDMEVCASAEELGVSLPATWSPEIEEMSQEPLVVVRYEGLLSPDALAKDLTMEKLDEYEAPYQRTSIVYTHDLGYCSDEECPPCPDPNDPDSAQPAAGAGQGCALSGAASAARPISVLVLLLVGLGIIARRRCRARLRQ